MRMTLAMLRSLLQRVMRRLSCSCKCNIVLAHAALAHVAKICPLWSCGAWGVLLHASSGQPHKIGVVKVNDVQVEVSHSPASDSRCLVLDMHHERADEKKKPRLM